MNSPSRCNNGMTITVTSCQQQAGREYCEVKVEQNGKLAFKDVDLRERVVAAVKSCVAQAAASRRDMWRKIAGDYRQWQVV